MNRYLLDSNIFITSEKYIPRDIFGSFWGELGNLLVSGTAILHKSVFDELTRRQDPLVAWIKSLTGIQVMPITTGTLAEYHKVCAWADRQNYRPEALRKFKHPNRADAWLCAEALNSNLTLVTYEVTSTRLHNVKIPDVCTGLNIPCIDGFDFMRRQRFYF